MIPLLVGETDARQDLADDLDRLRAAQSPRSIRSLSEAPSTYSIAMK